MEYSITLPTALVHEDGNLYSGKYVPSVSIKVDEEYAPEHEDKLGIDPIKQAQKRILEKAIDRLEVLKVPESEIFEANKVHNKALDKAIAEFKSLLGEV